ncbi:MAG: hypothetical protein Q7S21_05580 [archaeon]|nr:hypothetical protein [archaeon]
MFVIKNRRIVALVVIWVAMLVSIFFLMQAQQELFYRILPIMIAGFVLSLSLLVRHKE